MSKRSPRPAISPPDAPASAALVYKTQTLNFAAFLIVTNSLKYLRCENADAGVCAFVFEDPEQRGPRLAAEFLMGDPAVPMKKLRECINMLRTEMQSVKELGGGRGRG